MAVGQNLRSLVFFFVVLIEFLDLTKQVPFWRRRPPQDSLFEGLKRVLARLGPSRH